MHSLCLKRQQTGLCGHQGNMEKHKLKDKLPRRSALLQMLQEVGFQHLARTEWHLFSAFKLAIFVSPI